MKGCCLYNKFHKKKTVLRELIKGNYCFKKERKERLIRNDKVYRIALDRIEKKIKSTKVDI